MPNRPTNYKESSWEYSIEQRTLDFLEVSDLFLDKFSHKREEIRDFVISNGLFSKFFVVLEIVNEETPSYFLNNEFLKFASYLNAEIDTDIYVISS